MKTSAPRIKTHPLDFSAHVNLPCKLFCGPDQMLEYAGIAVTIDPSNVAISVPSNGHSDLPAIGEHVRLELALPASGENPKPKCLKLTAEVVGIKTLPNGSREVAARFRKARFKDLGGAEKDANPPRWRM